MSVNSLIRQPSFPFARFLEDRGQYKSSQAFWEEAFERGLPCQSDASNWVGWMDNPFFDGLPIWSVVNRTMQRGISVQQVRRNEDRIWFKCWISKTQFENMAEMPYLFVETFVSKQSYQNFSKLVSVVASRDFDLDDCIGFTRDLQKNSAEQGPPTLDD